MRRVASAFLAAVALAGMAPAVAATSGCDGPRAAFVGVIYDSAQRSDFQRDVTNFETFVSGLGPTYCLPRERVRILAFENSYMRDGRIYPAGTEAGFKQALRDIGAIAHANPEMVTFVMLSSHGSVYARPSTSCGGVGSYAVLKQGGGENGTLNDCELGQVLNESFPPEARIVTAIDCSFCGGFSDSITAVSGTARDDIVTGTSGIPGPNRIAMTGCAITTECFGGDTGGVTFEHLRDSMDPEACDGFTAPGFPAVQGVNAPVRTLQRDGGCTVSEWFFAAVWSAYTSRDPIAVQQQFRIKYGFSSLAEDIEVS